MFKLTGGQKAVFPNKEAKKAYSGEEEDKDKLECDEEAGFF